jgi:CBS domain-containing protein
MLDGVIASDLMSPNPVSIRSDATVVEATALLTDKGFGGAPVIDEAGRPVGVVSRGDLLVHDRERFDYLGSKRVSDEISDKFSDMDAFDPDSFQIVDVDRTPVSEIMTPVVFAVRPDTPANKVLNELASLRVHRLFVVDGGGILVGVVSALDVISALAEG